MAKANRDPMNYVGIKGADYARAVVREWEENDMKMDARERLADAAINIGKYTDDAKAFWRDYLADLRSGNKA